ncbi:MAG: YjbQ family protein [Spirochaetaceae bacterium]|jgi:secondary thiamine-phosphate synthase enzyme|nr:YjbQ family protein [Spirochaetaceae bacterium]
MIHQYTLKTDKQGFYNITGIIERAVAESGIDEGICTVFCPHTTAGITINENADPSVKSDLALALDKAFPNQSEFTHMEGNSAAHVKAAAIGQSASIIIGNHRLMLGTWQGVYFCEFDGPRERNFIVRIG